MDETETPGVDPQITPALPADEEVCPPQPLLEIANPDTGCPLLGPCEPVPDEAP